jgi:hypothetical protein
MMRVGLLNLGDGNRLFYNKIGRAVLVPVGKMVTADLDDHTLQGLKYPLRPETILVCEPEAPIPDEMQKVIDLLALLEFESHEILTRRFQEIAPPNNLVDLRPSRAQIRVALRTMVEDYIQAQISGEKIIRDDVDPDVLEEELEHQIHPIEKVKQEQVAEDMALPAVPSPVRKKVTVPLSDATADRLEREILASAGVRVPRKKKQKAVR